LRQITDLFAADPTVVQLNFMCSLCNFLYSCSICSLLSML